MFSTISNSSSLPRSRPMRGCGRRDQPPLCRRVCVWVGGASSRSICSISGAQITVIDALVGQLANDLQRRGKGERMKEEEGTTQEKASNGKSSERGFAVVRQAGGAGTAAGRQSHERTDRYGATSQSPAGSGSRKVAHGGGTRG